MLAWAPFAPFFLDETDFRADLQSAVGPIEHRIAVKIDFAAVGRFDEASLIPRQKLCHPTVAFRRVLLDLTLETNPALGPTPVDAEAALRVAAPLLEAPVADRPNTTLARLIGEIEARSE